MSSLKCAAVVLLLFFTVPCLAQKKTASDKSATPVSEARDSSARLPVKRVVLYKNGVGYFEHTTRVRGTQELNIDFTTGQLNDVLKSLTVVDLGEGRISSVRYNSVAPLSERLKGLTVAVRRRSYARRFFDRIARRSRRGP